jgi:hypothetical protein
MTQHLWLIIAIYCSQQNRNTGYICEYPLREEYIYDKNRQMQKRGLKCFRKSYQYNKQQTDDACIFFFFFFFLE